MTKLNDFGRWLCRRATYYPNAHDLAEEQLQKKAREGSWNRNEAQQNQPNPTPNQRNQRRVLQVREINCLKCKQAYKIEDCRACKELRIRERLETLKKAGTCFFCLLPGHVNKDGGRAKKCNIRGCTRYHHALLHENQKESLGTPRWFTPERIRRKGRYPSRTRSRKPHACQAVQRRKKPKRIQWDKNPVRMGGTGCDEPKKEHVPWTGQLPTTR